MKTLEVISDEITILEAIRDYGDITNEEIETLAVLNLCYDLLTRTHAAQSLIVEQPEEMKEPGFEDDFIQKYGVCSSQLADFAFAIATKRGSVNLRNLMRDVMYGHKQADIADRVKIRPATISDYLNMKKEMTTNNYEKIINVILEE